MIFCLIGKALSWSVKGKNKGIYFQNEPVDLAQRDYIEANDQSFTGSFCTTVQGNYEFKIIGRQSFYVDKFGNMDVSGWGEKSARCDWWNHEQNRAFDLDGNTCYPFKARMGYYCLFQKSYLEFQAKFPGTDNFVIIGKDNAIREEYSDCVDGWYGKRCEKDCRYTYCNENGEVFNGHEGNGYCKCNKFSEPFCEDPNKEYFIQKPLIFQESFDKKINYTATVQMLENPVTIKYATYSNIFVRGFIHIPQHGKYAFRILCSQKTRFTVGKIVVGSEGDRNEMFICKKPVGEKEYIIPEMIYERGNTPFELFFYGGCSMFGKGFIIQWKNYRYNYDNENIGWETIPMRFMGLM